MVKYKARAIEILLFLKRNRKISLNYEGLFQKLSTALVKVRWKFSDEAL